MSALTDSKRFREALATFATGVTIVTTVDQTGADVGVTASSFNSVSLEPPMVLWSLGRKSSRINAFLAAGHFAVHVLAREQEALAGVFSARSEDHFAGLSLTRGFGGIPLLEGCAARFQCRTAFQYEGGDHVILVGEVLAFDHCQREPLLFHGGRFGLAVAPCGVQMAVGADRAAEPGLGEPDFLIDQLGRAYHRLLARLWPELQRRRLAVADYVLLRLLSGGENVSLAELQAKAAQTGVQVNAELVQRLTERGLVEQIGESAGTLRPSAQGRQMRIELLAIAEAAAEEVESQLDPSESLLLRQLLGRIVAPGDRT
jgi:3-hydroxy-9,10-secoandrosta-1,3,5(10)-triene-9,17-dione monooxygenase reductase component